MPDRALIAFRDKPASDYTAVVIERFIATARGVPMLQRVAAVHAGDATKLRNEVLGHGRDHITGATPSALLLEVPDADWIVTWDGNHCQVWVSSPLRYGLSLWAEARAGEERWHQTSEKPPTRLGLGGLGRQGVRPAWDLCTQLVASGSCGQRPRHEYHRRPWVPRRQLCRRRPSVWATGSACGLYVETDVGSQRRSRRFRSAKWRPLSMH